MTVSFDTDTIRLITLFENLTGTSVRDCLVGENQIVYFIIEEGKAGMAIGKNGYSVKNAENLIKKDIKIFEFSKDLRTFVKNLIPQADEIKVRNENERTIVEIKVEKKDKATVIGRDSRNIKLYRELLQRSHDVDSVVVR